MVIFKCIDFLLPSLDIVNNSVKIMPKINKNVFKSLFQKSVWVWPDLAFHFFSSVFSFSLTRVCLLLEMWVIQIASLPYNGECDIFHIYNAIVSLASCVDGTGVSRPWVGVARGKYRRVAAPRQRFGRRCCASVGAALVDKLPPLCELRGRWKRSTLSLLGQTAREA